LLMSFYSFKTKLWCIIPLLLVSFLQVQSDKNPDSNPVHFVSPAKYVDFRPLLTEILSRCDLSVRDLYKSNFSLQNYLSCFETVLTSNQGLVFYEDKFLDRPSVSCDLRGCFFSGLQEKIYLTERVTPLSCQEDGDGDLDVTVESFARRLDCFVRRLGSEYSRDSVREELNTVSSFNDLVNVQEAAMGVSLEFLKRELQSYLSNFKAQNLLQSFSVDHEGWLLKVTFQLVDQEIPSTIVFTPSSFYVFDSLSHEKQVLERLIRKESARGQVFLLVGPADFSSSSTHKALLPVDGFSILHAIEQSLKDKLTMPETPIETLFSRRLSLSLFGASIHSAAHLLSRHQTDNSSDGDFDPASSEPLFDAPKNELIAVIRGFDYTLTPRQDLHNIFANPRVLLERFNFVSLAVDFSAFLDFSFIPPIFRNIQLIRLSDGQYRVNLNFTENDLNPNLSPLGFFLQAVYLSGTSLGDFHGGGGTDAHQPSLDFFSVKFDRRFSDNDSEDIDRRKKAVACCLLGVWTLHNFNVDADYAGLLNQCAEKGTQPQINIPMFEGLAGGRVKVSLERAKTRQWNSEVGNYDETYQNFLSCRVLVRPDVLHRDKSLAMHPNCHSGYNQAFLVETDIVQPVGAYARSWHLRNVRDLIMPVCDYILWNRRDNKEAYLRGQCSAGLKFWYDWMLGLDLSGYSYVRNGQTEFLSDIWYARADGMSLSRGNLNRFDRIRVCESSGFPGLYSKNIHLISHNHLNNYSLAYTVRVGGFPPNLLTADLNDPICNPTLSGGWSPVAIAGVRNFGFVRGETISHPLPNFHQLDSYRFYLRSVQGSIEGRGSFFKGAGRTINGQWYHVPATSFHMLVQRNFTNQDTNLFKYGGFTERGNPNQHVEFFPTVSDVNVFDIREQDPNLRNSVIITFTSPLDIYWTKVILPDSIPLKDSNGNPIRGNRQILDLKRFLLEGGVVIEDRDARGIRGLAFKFRSDRRGVKILPRSLWKLDWEDFKKKFGIKQSSMQSQYDWPYFVEIHVTGQNKLKQSPHVSMPLIGNSTTHYSEMSSLTDSAVTKRKWVWPLREPDFRHLFSPPHTMFDKLTFLRSPLYTVGLGKLFAGRSPLSELQFTMERLLVHNPEHQTVFILRVPVLPRGTLCLLAYGCKRYKKNGRCSRNWSGGMLIAEGGEEGGEEDCEIKICGVQPDNEDRAGECREINFDEDTGEDDKGPIEKCELGKASCCPTPASLPEGTDPETCPTVYCEEGGPFENEADKENFKRQCEGRGWKFHEQCKFNGWWSNCCGDEGTMCNRRVSGGCCPPDGEGEASEEVCDGPPWEAEQVELASGEVVRCAKREEYCPSTSNSTNCQNEQNSANSANSANVANQANVANTANQANVANLANRGGSNNVRGSPFQNFSNIRGIPIRNVFGGMNLQGGGSGDCELRFLVKSRDDLRKERKHARKFRSKDIRHKGMKRSRILVQVMRAMPCPTPIVVGINW
jgi:hypothetical protein